MNKRELTAELKNAAHRLGFQLTGACRAVNAPGGLRLREWLARGFAGQMHFMSDRCSAYEHPNAVLPGVKSLLMLGMNYRSAEPAEVGKCEGRVSRYAWGPGDYHDLIHDRLRQLSECLLVLCPQARARGVVDTAPLLEREFAQLAGLGWIGKNTLLINRQLGSWFFLAALLTDQELEYDGPFAADHCGTCRACLDACPTQAFVEPRVLDATRCISYLTIELRAEIPAEQRIGLNQWVFGCDVCQDVCPWNRATPRSDEASFFPAAAHDSLDLVELLSCDDEQFRARFRRTALWRAKRRGLLRTAAVILGNRRPQKAIPALLRGLRDSEPLVREACAWALGKYERPETRTALHDALADESEPRVRQAIQRALQEGREAGAAGSDP
jgi:epoxyqueuosine reductase